LNYATTTETNKTVEPNPGEPVDKSVRFKEAQDAVSFTWADSTDYPRAARRIIDATTTNLENYTSLMNQWNEAVSAKDNNRMRDVFFGAVDNIKRQGLNQKFVPIPGTMPLTSAYKQNVLKYDADRVALINAADAAKDAAAVGKAIEKGVSVMQLADNLVAAFNKLFTAQY
jgi:hypothetical protein